MPRSASAGTSGIVPPERSSSGRRPRTLLEGVLREPDGRRASGGMSPAGEDERRSTSSSAPGGAASRSSRSKASPISSASWPGARPDRDVGLGEDREAPSSGGPPRRPGARSRPRRGRQTMREVEVVGRVPASMGTAPASASTVAAGVELLPGAELLLGGRDDAGAQLVRDRHDRRRASPAGHGRRSARRRRTGRSEGRAPRAQAHVEVDEPAHRQGRTQACPPEAWRRRRRDRRRRRARPRRGSPRSSGRRSPPRRRRRPGRSRAARPPRPAGGRP